MYSLINQHIELILQKLEQSQVVPEYDWLVSRLHQTNVATDVEYQRRYRAFWVMNQARLSAQFFSLYFMILQSQKDDPRIDLQSVCQQLYQASARRNGHKCLQFSFGSKLVHMTCQQLPIYDSKVRNFYYLPVPNGSRSLEDKLQGYMQSFSFLGQEYHRILQAGLLRAPIAAFRNRFQPICFTDEKIIDSLIWAFVDIAEKGGFQNGTFQHR